MSDINVPPQLLAVSLMFSIMTAAVQHTTQCITLQNVEWQCNFSISSLGFRIVMTTINNHFRAYSKSVQWERKSAFVWRCLYHADFVLIGTFLFEKKMKKWPDPFLIKIHFSHCPITLIALPTLLAYFLMKSFANAKTPPPAAPQTYQPMYSLSTGWNYFS